jgi:hypothetical protein
LITLFFAAILTASAEGPRLFGAGDGQQTFGRNMNWGSPIGSAYGSPAVYAQGWSGYPSFGGNFYQPYNYSSHFPYLYFYEQYAREAEESRRAADEYEASLAREGKLTGPLQVGAFKSDSLPRSPLKLQLTLDGQAVTPSPSGAPLVIESGEHTLRVGLPSLSSGN